MKTFMICMLRNHHQSTQRGFVDLLEDGRVVWHETDNVVSWWHGDFLIPATPVTATMEIFPPELVETYLHQAGWTEPQLRSATYATFHKGVAWLDVPVCVGHFAYPRGFRALLANLARFESRSVEVILGDMAGLAARLNEKASQ